jgi:hypothetical protein
MGLELDVTRWLPRPTMRRDSDRNQTIPLPETSIRAEDPQLQSLAENSPWPRPTYRRFCPGRRPPQNPPGHRRRPAYLSAPAGRTRGQHSSSRPQLAACAVRDHLHLGHLTLPKCSWGGGVGGKKRKEKRIPSSAAAATPPLVVVDARPINPLPGLILFGKLAAQTFLSCSSSVACSPALATAHNASLTEAAAACRSLSTAPPRQQW